jgi:hypothetical protein
MNALPQTTRRELEHCLNDALRDVALELRTTEALDLVSDIHRMAFANLGDLVHSALELHFRPEALIFAYTGHAALNWFGPPSIGLDLELHADGVDVYFRLMIEALAVDVRIQHFAMDGLPGSVPLERLSLALAAARIPSQPSHQPRTSYRA